MKSGMWLIMVSVAWLAGVTSGIPCEEARLKCAYRVGCGMALQHYLVGCSAVLQGDTFPEYCPEVCQYTLTALTSTEEGMALMNCECSDDYCRDQKVRTDICKPKVMHSMSSDVVPCRVAQWICMADALCAKALEYYNEFCKAMFHGKKCTLRCNNSINILRRQEKATKLKTCKCDGYEDYDCHGIQRNMDKLCFHKHSRHHNRTHTEWPHNTTHREFKEDEEIPTVILASSSLKLTISWAVMFSIVLALVT
ncbi:growth arrest-specific protein 1 isoform X1 [Diabrotica virgifera virgifera]|uniref:Growth arrest-specific protein 1-like isoform X2 n=1 Tax=Diabrotica virgifera virgifera TaxID=50390 RepID=A0A6P7FJI5_DIAVI|nr:growth arrest-specific protein 1 isoform X1 [Diabrotica virgifera virgifera]